MTTDDIGMVHTPRMRGEPIGPAHLEVLTEMHADAALMRTLGGVRTRAATTEIIDQLVAGRERDGFSYWVFFDLETGDFAGRGGLRRLDIVDVGTEVEVGWAVARDRWRQGLATEIAEASLGVAFEVLGLDSVVAFTEPSNEASLGVMRTTGFVYERDFTYAELDHVLFRRRAG